MASVFCEECKMNVLFCKCSGAIQKKTIPQRILEVLADHGIYTKKDLVTATGLDKEESYVDMGRAIRHLVEEGHPVEFTKAVGGHAGQWRLVRDEEAEAFWTKHMGKERKWIKPREVEELKNRISELEAVLQKTSELEAQISALQAENKFLSDYVSAQDAEIQDLKSPKRLVA